MFDNPEPLVTLPALAGATERIRLQTEVLLGPLRSTVLLAKQVSTIDPHVRRQVRARSRCRRPAVDHAAAGTPLNQRGRMLDQQLDDLHRIRSGDAYSALGAMETGGPIGPQPGTPGGPPILIGAFAPAALARVACHGDEFVCAAPLQWAGHLIEQAHQQWKQAGRHSRPCVVGQVNVAVADASTLDTARAARPGCTWTCAIRAGR